MSNAIDKPSASQPFISLWVVAAFIVVVIIVLILLFPEKSLRAHLLSNQEPSPVALYYLDQLIKVNPQDNLVRVALIKQQIDAGQWEAARQQLDLLAKQTQGKEAQIQINGLTLNLLLNESFSLKPGNARREKLLTNARTLLLEVALSTNDPQQLRQLADDALAIKKPDVAFTIYQRFDNLQPINDPVLLEKIAKIALSVENYAASGHYYFLAVKRTTDVEKQRQLIKAGLLALQAGNLLNQGLVEVEQLPNYLLDDKTLLVFLTHYAMTANRPDLAQKYIKHALLLSNKVKHE